jgi:uncharacterized lipoprotein NlpE involved in copper resistance
MAAKFVPKLLSPEQQHLCLEVVQDMLECANRDPEFLKTVITGDKPETRCSRQNGSETRMRQTHVTPLRYLAATDASGSVARQQKITHTHENPFYHNAQFPHPYAITCHGKK